MKTIIELIGVTKSYFMGSHQVHALKEIDLQVCEGEWLGIMGPSGSGKSTLMHLTGCLDLPSQGIYLFDGEDVSSLNDKTLSMIRAKKIGFIFQAFNLIPQLNVLENVEIPFLYHHEKRSHIRKRILEAIDRVGLSHRRYHLPTELSGGEMQRVAIARALAINPLLVLADEPTGNLDSETGSSILELFADLNQQGVTIMIVTHDEEVGKHCKRLIRMKDGLIISDSSQPPSEVNPVVCELKPALPIAQESLKLKLCDNQLKLCHICFGDCSGDFEFCPMKKEQPITLTHFADIESIQLPICEICCGDCEGDFEFCPKMRAKRL